MRYRRSFLADTSCDLVEFLREFDDWHVSSRRLKFHNCHILQTPTVYNMIASKQNVYKNFLCLPNITLCTWLIWSLRYFDELFHTCFCILKHNLFTQATTSPATCYYRNKMFNKYVLLSLSYNTTTITNNNKQ